MRTGAMVAALTGSGLVGGLAGAFLVQGSCGAPAPAAPAAAPSAREDSSGLPKEVAALRARLDEMQASVASASEEATRLRGDLEKERTAAAETRARMEKIESAPAGAHLPGMLQGDWSRGAVAAADGTGAVRIAGLEGLSERMRKAAELHHKSVDERWASARDALSLTAGQEEELKAAIKERNDAMRDSIKLEKPEGATEGDRVTSIRIADPEKMREARKRYDDRVGSSLSQEQAKKWRDDGYESALGGGTMTMTSAVLVEDGR